MYLLYFNQGFFGIIVLGEIFYEIMVYGHDDFLKFTKNILNSKFVLNSYSQGEGRGGAYSLVYGVIYGNEPFSMAC